MDDVQLLEAMVRTPSLSGAEHQLAELLRHELSARGFAAHIDAAGNVVGERGDPSTGPTVLLLGHMDTVTGVVPVRREGDILYGRGAVDAKGPLAACIAAASTHQGPGLVRVVGAVEEESATSKGARHLTNQDQPDFVVIGEPSNWDRVTVGYKGRVLVHYRVERTMAHTAAAQPTASQIAFEFWRDVLEAVAGVNAVLPEQAFDQLQSSLRAMRSSSDGLTETAELEAGFRLPVGFEIQRWESTLSALAGGAALRCYAYEQAVRVEKNTALARALLTGIRAQGGEPRFVVKTGTSDLNVVAARWRCPMVAYGPGDSGFDHTPEEQISLLEYERSIQVLRTALAVLLADVG